MLLGMNQLSFKVDEKKNELKTSVIPGIKSLTGKLDEKKNDMKDLLSGIPTLQRQLSSKVCDIKSFSSP